MGAIWVTALSGRFQAIIGPGSSAAYQFFTQLMIANVVLVLFNLIPAFPMDGGRILRALLANRFAWPEATAIAVRVGRWLALGMLVFGLFVILELFSSLLLGVPIVTGRTSDFRSIENELIRLLTLDPLFVTVLHFLLWMVYPVIRLAWFFCYLDVRIQKEGWDVDLDFRIEAQRLKSLT